MDTKNTGKQDIYDCIVAGGGASGFFFAAGDSSPGRKLILEKTSRPGQKLLMTGNGMCNITHAGSIKDFVAEYGKNGKLIRTILYKHSNLELMDFMESIGVPLTEREDGKVFPSSLKASDVLSALLDKARLNGWEIKIGAEVNGISVPDADGSGRSGDTARHIYAILTEGGCFLTRKLVISTGGKSYPVTGSDGSFFSVLERDLCLSIVPPHPALAPVYVQNYGFSGLSGISLPDTGIHCGGFDSRGPVLLTHRGFSGPAILRISEHVKPGDEMILDFLPDLRPEDVLTRLTHDRPGNSQGAANYAAASFGLPKAFVSRLLGEPQKKLSSLTKKELQDMVRRFKESTFSVSGTGGWNDAMVTAGGVALAETDLRTMELKGHPGIYVIGEALDISGDTGGYNLQFAFSSAMTAIG